MYYVQIYRMLEFVHKSDNLILVDNPTKADLVMAECSHITAPRVQTLIDSYPNKSIILLNKMDSPMLAPVVRQNIEKENVKLVYSAGVLTDKNNYNAPMPHLNSLEAHTCDPSGPCPHKHFPVGHFNSILNEHYKEIPTSSYRPQLPFLKDSCLDKIKLAPMSRTNVETHWAQKYYKNHGFSCTEEDYRQRDIDVSFVGQSWRGHELFGTHREQVGSILNSMKETHGTNTVCVLNHRTTVEGKKQQPEGIVLNFEDYNDILFRSKIVIGAWGAGEWCQRDAEAVYTGAVLIKPDMSHMEVFPNFYLKDKTYVSCSPGLLDLEQKILGVLANWESYYNMRTLAKNMIDQSWDFSTHIKILEKDIFERCL
jgi:hypothetical protein